MGWEEGGAVYVHISINMGWEEDGAVYVHISINMGWEEGGAVVIIRPYLDKNEMGGGWCGGNYTSISR